MDLKWLSQARIFRTIQWDGFNVVAGDDLDAAMNDVYEILVFQRTNFEKVPKIREIAVCPLGKDAQAALCRMTGIGGDRIEWVLFAEGDEYEAFRANGFTMLDGGEFPILQVEGSDDYVPFLTAGKLAMLDETSRVNLAENFAMMDVLSACGMAGLPSDNLGTAQSQALRWTLGHEVVYDGIPDAGWRKAYWSHRNRIDENALAGVGKHDAIMAVSEHISGCKRIWDTELKRRHITEGIRSVDFATSPFEDILELAEAFGVDRQIEALYEGVPVDDIVA